MAVTGVSRQAGLNAVATARGGRLLPLQIPAQRQLSQRLFASSSEVDTVRGQFLADGSQGGLKEGNSSKCFIGNRRRRLDCRGQLLNSLQSSRLKSVP